MDQNAAKMRSSLVREPQALVRWLICGSIAGVLFGGSYAYLWLTIFEVRVDSTMIFVASMLLAGVTGAAFAAWQRRRSSNQCSLGTWLGFLTGLIVTVWNGGPTSLRALGALLLAGLYLGLICAAGGAVIGAAGGALVGGFTGRAGQAALRRPGAILGAALAWTAATVLGGLFAGDFAARIAGAPGAASATLGVVLQVLVSAALLPLARRGQRRWQGWRTGRP